MNIALLRRNLNIFKGQSLKVKKKFCVSNLQKV